MAQMGHVPCAFSFLHWAMVGLNGNADIITLHRNAHAMLNQTLGRWFGFRFAGLAAIGATRFLDTHLSPSAHCHSRSFKYQVSCRILPQPTKILILTLICRSFGL